MRATTAIVTGAGRGIGAAIAQRLAADGYAVAVLDVDLTAARKTAASISQQGGRALALGVDIADERGVAETMNRVCEEFSAPVVLVNNAGITRDNLVYKMSASEWDDVIAVHLRGTFLMCRAAQRWMVDAGWGRIVNISSTAALGNRGQVNYSAAKSGVQGLTKTLAIELGSFGVTVNCVAPGFIVTEMTRATAERINAPWDKYVADRAAQIPVARAGEPSDIANAVSFFAHDGSGFVNGQVLYVAGGPRA